MSPNVFAIGVNAVGDAASNLTKAITSGSDSSLENLNNGVTNTIEDDDTEEVTETEGQNTNSTSVPQMLYYSLPAAVEVDSSVLTYTTYTDNSVTRVSITGYTGTEANIIIPDSINNILVGKIGSNAFKNNNIIQSVTLPSSIKVIDTYAFYGCSQLVSVSFSDSLQTVGSYAFHNCDKLLEVTLPNSVQTIGSYSFESCDQLATVNIGKNLDNWGTQAFANNAKLTTINFAEGLQNIGKHTEYYNQSTSYDSYYSYKDIMSRYGSTFYNCDALETVVIPDSVTDIWQGAFAECSSLTSVTFGSDLERVGCFAFYNSVKLSDITTSSMYFTVGYQAFNGTSLKSITAPLNSEAAQYATDNSISFTEYVGEVVKPVTSITISQTSADLEEESTLKLAATITPNDADNQNVIWASSSDVIATVDDEGNVVAVSEGIAVITATSEDGGFVACCIVNVSAKKVVIYGDCSGDGIVDAADAILIQRHDAGLIVLTEEQLLICDLNNDGLVDVADAIKILKFDAGLISSVK